MGSGETVHDHGHQEFRANYIGNIYTIQNAHRQQKSTTTITTTTYTTRTTTENILNVAKNLRSQSWLHVARMPSLEPPPEIELTLWRQIVKSVRLAAISVLKVPRHTEK
eukprot:1541968-Amphidinium_carterae.1